MSLGKFEISYNIIDDTNLTGVCYIDIKSYSPLRLRSQYWSRGCSTHHTGKDGIICGQVCGIGFSILRIFTKGVRHESV